MRRLSRLFIVAGLAMLGWCAYVWVDSGVAQYAARQSLDVSGPALPRSPLASNIPPPIADVTPPPARGAAIAELSIPRVNLSAVVLHGSDARTLRRGPGHLEDTPLPGQPGNIVIAGHRDSFFRQLRYLAVGDEVFLDSPAGRFRYQISSLRVVHPWDTTVLAQTSDETLTLITCFPFWVLGDAPDRFIVRATRTDEPAVVVNQSVSLMPATSLPVVVGGTDAVAVASPSARAQPRSDDRSQVREVLARFRSAYNARLASRVDTREMGSLVFAACEISVTGDDAEAQCLTSGTAHEHGVATTWSFTLERRDVGWAIREIVAK
jgi:sortase A